MIWGRADRPHDAIFVVSLDPRIWFDDQRACHQALAKGSVPDHTSVPGVIEGRGLASDEATRAMAAWNSASGPDQARCHIPRHGLGTVTRGRVDWFATICFECANAHVHGPSATERHRIIEWQGCPLERCLNEVLALR